VELYAENYALGGTCRSLALDFRFWQIGYNRNKQENDHRIYLSLSRTHDVYDD